MTSLRTYSWLPMLLLWFGASISVAEIYTGALMTPAGLQSGLWAIISGHIVGVILLGLIGLIGYRENKPSIMCTRLSFGRSGSYFLSLANVLQLIGWTAVMIQQSGQALAGITQHLWNVGSQPIAIIIMGALVGLWTLWESKGQHLANMLAVILLFLLTLVMSYVLFKHPAPVAQTTPHTMSFWVAFELSLLMPLSWVPLVADYAHKAKNIRIAAFAPALGYFVGSIWMYGIGFFTALITKESDPTTMLLVTGLGVVALGVVMLSALTTTFLDVYSAVLSAKNIYSNLPEKIAVIAVTIIGVVAALWLNSELYMSFLYLIGSVFAPLSAILIIDFYILKVNKSQSSLNLTGLCSLLCGMAIDWLIHSTEIIVSPLLGCLIATAIIHLCLRALTKDKLSPQSIDVFKVSTEK